MLLFIYNIILSRFTFHIGSNQRHFSIPFLYGFQSEGTYTINLKNNESDNFIFLIATEEEMEKFMTEQNLYKPCNVTVPINYYTISQLNNESSKITGTIEKRGMYNTTILSCEYFHSEFSVEMIYNNPTSHLSYNVQNILITNPIIVVISIILFILWIINWLRNFTMKNLIHIILTISFLFFVIEKILFLFESIEKNKSDEISYYGSFRGLAQHLYLTYILSAFLSISNQYFLNHFVNMRIFILFINVVVSYNLAKTLITVDYFGDGSDTDINEVVSVFIWEAMLVFSLFSSFIINNGDVKIFFVVTILIVAVFYLIFYAFYSCENTFLVDFYIVFSMDIVHIVFLSAFGFYFKLNPNNQNNYLYLQFDE